MVPILYLFNALTNYLFVILYNVGLPVPVLSEKARAVNVSSTSVSFFFFFFLFFGGGKEVGGDGGVDNCSGWHTGSVTFLLERHPIEQHH